MMFKYPLWFWTLLPILLTLGFFLKRKNKFQGAMNYSSIAMLIPQKKSLKLKVIQNLLWLRYLGIILCVIALARPQTIKGIMKNYSEGIDIMLVMDASESMFAEDFQPHNRFYVAKEKATQFIAEREGDRIGLVVFGEEAFTQCPLTLDLNLLENRIQQTQIGIIPAKKTAIGTAIATGLNRLKKSKATSQIMILLTDGSNNYGKINPLTAAGFAKELGVKIYTIGVGKTGKAPITIQDPVFGKQQVFVQTEIDEKLLTEIADQTGGAYFRATTSKGLEEIYQKINLMEKTKYEMTQLINYKQWYHYFLMVAFICFMIEFLLRLSWLKILPGRYL